MPRIIQWLLGGGLGVIVNVLVPFTKPQPKKVTQKIPERKQCTGCGSDILAVDGALAKWPHQRGRKQGSGLTTSTWAAAYQNCKPWP